MYHVGIACMVTAGVLIGGAAFAEETPRFYEPETFESETGIFIYMFQDDALWRSGVISAEHRATPDCVTRPVALECSFPAAAGPAGFLEFELDHTLPADDGGSHIPADAVGIALYMKGDGSAGKARIEIRNDYTTPGASVEIPLADKSWRRVMLKWSDFSPGPSLSTEVLTLCFGVSNGTVRPASYRIDALRIVTSTAPDSALESLAAAANSREAEPPAPYRVSPAACAYNKGGLAKARSKLRRGEPVKWLAYGDSVTVPVQMWNVPEDLVRAKYAWYAAAKETLESEFGSRIDIVVDAVGGRQLEEDFDSLQTSLEKERPDVLLVFSGTYKPQYDNLLPVVLEKARAVGAEVVFMTPTYDADPYRHAPHEYLRNWCIENNVACADTRTYLLCTGEPYWGYLFANHAHPNVQGHRLIGQVVAEMFR